ncbi:superoxide dismutase [Mycolicibacterium sp. BiH015]|uniref:superoxide dismutase n=1 Tax=Mycolicibacterium sp. BiH015 TaxID=3018808 RepID=UPI0022E817C4|nr:superoxide dismutase [Mycolicibacterium sp. BiH015]MDA2893233.1 superoxide dismutase [Mycolicibacterium sp. BiH015]
MVEYTLPELDYDYGALEPHISGQINEIHHRKHHAAYVKGLNDAIAKLEEARINDDHAAIFLNEKNLAFHLGGHVNHTIWWKNLSPRGGDKPTGELAAAIDDQFGSFDKFRAQFAAAANGLQGSGWAVLGYDTLGHRLLTFQLYDQQANVPLGIVPLLQVDMWEHAYYLQYKNVKADYVTAFWNVVNWQNVHDRFAAATDNLAGVKAGYSPWPVPRAD